MAFPDFPFDTSSRAFPSHTVVQKYLQDYANEFNLMELISLNTHVENVKLGMENSKWIIGNDEFDFLVVANGHYSAPDVSDMFRNTNFRKGVEILHAP